MAPSRVVLTCAVLLLTLTAGKCVPSHSCPRLIEYSPEFRAAFAAEAQAIVKTSPHVVQVLKDYWAGREQVTKCLEGLKDTRERKVR